MQASQSQYDVIIVGGGIYGAMLLLEASRRGQAALLLERNDFGAGTSYNNLRIVHGGLRYLQTLDLKRFRESVQERRWLLQTFPDLVRPLPCLMPLYGAGARRPSILALALKANDLLSRHRNQGVVKDWHLPDGHVLDTEQTQAIFPQVKRTGLKGAALWYDACMPDSHRILMEALRWACHCGAVTINYLAADGVLSDRGRVTGVKAKDTETGQRYQFSGRSVINATGPASRAWAGVFHKDLPQLFRPSLAWNLLFDRDALSDHALAVAADGDKGHTYFVHPWKGRLLIGTGHAPWEGDVSEPPCVSEQHIAQFIRDVNQAIPDLALKLPDVEKIFSGFLPVTRTGGVTLSKQETIIDHGKLNGLHGLYSLSGVKFTTARRVAERVLDVIGLKNIRPSTEIGKELKNTQGRPPSQTQEWVDYTYDWLPSVGETRWLAGLAKLTKEESVLHLDDLIFRRTNLGDNLHRVETIAPQLCGIFGWNPARCQEEIGRLTTN